jgi:tape measure domain-containing protein
MAEYRLQFTADTVAANRAIKSLLGEIQKVSKDFKGAENASRQAFHPLSLAAYETKLKALRAQARLIAPDTTQWKSLNKEILQAQRGVDKLNKMQRTGPSAQQRIGAAGGAFLYGGGMGGGVGSAALGIAGGLMGGVPGAFAGAAGGQVIDNLIQQAAGVAALSAEYSKSRIALAGVTTDQQDFNRAIEASSQIGQKFLLPISDATKQFTKLQASVRGAGYDTDVTIKAFSGIASAIVATGGSTEDLNGALLATSQVFSKGKVSAEELRQQIGERLAGAFTIFADSSGIAAKALDELLSKGEVTLDDFIKFLEELNKRYGETSEILANAPENAGPRLQVALQAMSIAYGGFFQKVGAGFQAYATDLVNFTLANQEEFKKIIATIAVVAQDIYTIFSGLIDSLIPPLASFFKFIFENFSRGMNALANLADESRRAAGGPEQRAARAVEQLYPNPLDRALKGGPAFQEALKVELARDQTGKEGTKSREQRIATMADQMFSPYQPSKFGAALSGKPPQRPGLGDEKSSQAASKLDTYDRSQLDFIRLRLEAEKQSLDQRLQAGLLSETAHKIAVAELELESSKEEVAEKLRLSRLAINRDNLTAADKLLKLKDTEIIAEREINIATNKRNIAIEGATKELAGPFNDAMNTARLQMEEQQMLLGNLRDGIENLTPDQEAYLKVQAMTVDLQEDEINLIQAKIAATRLAIEEQLKLNDAVKQESKLFQLGNDLAVAKAFMPDEELRTRLAQEGLTGENLEKGFALSKQVQEAENFKKNMQSIASSIGNSFGEAFKGIITGSMTAQQALAGMFQSIANSFADMAAQMIAEYMRMQALGLLKTIFGAVAPALGAAAGGLSSSAAGFGGSFDAGIPAIGGTSDFSGAFKFANGGLASGGFTAFANGGMVTGPTLGLLGEGRYDEAIIPLPDGKSVPVQLSGGVSGNAAPINTNIVVNVKNGQAESQTSGSQGNQLARELEGAVRQVILKESRPGGLISSSR